MGRGSIFVFSLLPVLGLLVSFLTTCRETLLLPDLRHGCADVCKGWRGEESRKSLISWVPSLMKQKQNQTEDQNKTVTGTSMHTGIGLGVGWEEWTIMNAAMGLRWVRSGVLDIVFEGEGLGMMGGYRLGK